MTLTHAARTANRAVLADLLPGSKIRDVVLVLAGTALVAVLAQIAILVPPSPVPVTGQTLGVVFVASALGASRGVASLSLYAALGTVLPIYADGASGLAVLTGPSGGYIVGFVVAAAVVGRLAEIGGDRRLVVAFASFVVGQLAVFAVGVPWLMAATGQSLGWSVHNGFSIFVVGGLMKAAIGAALLPAAWRAARSR